MLFVIGGPTLKLLRDWRHGGCSAHIRARCSRGADSLLRSVLIAIVDLILDVGIHAMLWLSREMLLSELCIEFRLRVVCCIGNHGGSKIGILTGSVILHVGLVGLVGCRKRQWTMDVLVRLVVGSALVLRISRAIWCGAVVESVHGLNFFD